MSTFSNNLIITKIVEFWKMLILQNFKKIFVTFAQKRLFLLEWCKKRNFVANLLEILHRESNAFFGNVQRLDLHFYVVADGEHFAWMLDEFFADL